MEICKNKDIIKDRLIKYYNYLYYLLKTISSKNLNNILIQKGGYMHYHYYHHYHTLPLLPTPILIVFIVIFIIYIIINIYMVYKEGHEGGNKINNYEDLFKKNKKIIEENMCGYERLNQLICYKNYLNNKNFNESMIDIKNFLITNSFISMFLQKIFEIISIQGEELVSLKNSLDNNFFFNIINYKIIYLGKNEVRKNIIYYKFSLINKKTSNVYNFELTFNQIKKIFSLKSFSKVKYFINDKFFNFLYNIIKNVRKDINNNNKSTLLNYLFKSRRNKRVSDNINDISLMYKLLKRFSSNLFLKINNNFNNLKLNKYYDIKTLLKNGHTNFINNFVDDLCNQKNIKITIIDENFNKIDKKIDKLEKNN
jgi:hypothetical protein